MTTSMLTMHSAGGWGGGVPGYETITGATHAFSVEQL